MIYDIVLSKFVIRASELLSNGTWNYVIIKRGKSSGSRIVKRIDGFQDSGSAIEHARSSIKTLAIT